jgi:hypothetical protein
MILSYLTINNFIKKVAFDIKYKILKIKYLKIKN